MILNVQREIITIVSKTAIIICCGLLFCACAATGQVSVKTPQGKSESYPGVIEDSAERQKMIEESWRNLLAESGLPYTAPDLFPVLNTPRSLPLELAGKINVNKKNTKFGEMEAKESLRSFIERARGVLFGDPNNPLLGLKDLSLLSFNLDGNYYRAFYRQMSYRYTIANGFGELALAVDKNGKLLQLSSRLIPFLDLPANPEVKSQEIAASLIGREFTYTTIAGRPQSYKVTKREEVVIKDLVVYPKQEGDKILIHVAYPFEVGSGMTWTVYIDAINGRELAVKQNFAS